MPIPIWPARPPFRGRRTRQRARISTAWPDFVDLFIASYSKAPQLIVLDTDHSEDTTHGQQQLSFYNHQYSSYGYLPLLLSEGLSGEFITAVLRCGKRPKEAENAMILKRVLTRACRLARSAFSCS